ncbi:AAA family ATPase [Streptomyces cyaneofuscatus]|uniref:helix-turn-helix transcriptional regulator n=1 Tax=Streptomyces cyaneofuscatus TaxID=66883 RepID=UPI003660F0C9
MPRSLTAQQFGGPLIGRTAELAALSEFVSSVQVEQTSRVLVVHGEPGVGKTALLEHLARSATGSRVIRCVGVQSEMELAFSGLHYLCAPLLDHLGNLPPSQRDSLRAVFDGRGCAPDPMMIGMAVLGLLAHIAERQSLICLVDDHQWLDSESARILGFVARRLGAESVGLVFATRLPGADLSALPHLEVGNLSPSDAGAVLDSMLTGPLDREVRTQVIAEARGNPLALLELPRGMSAAEMAGGFGVPSSSTPTGRVEESFRRRIDALPDDARMLILLAAADPTGNSALVWKAAAKLRIGVEMAAALSDAGIAEFGTRVSFRHPLSRSVAYQAASPANRRSAHEALAESTEEHVDPDRRAWHRAQAAIGPDEEVASALVRSAERAGRRGGLAAAAAFQRRAVILTPNSARRAERALNAAEVHIRIGAVDLARDLLEMIDPVAVGGRRRADIDVLHAQIAFITERGGQAALLLLGAARKLRPVDAALCRTAYLDALSAAIFAGRLSVDGSCLRHVVREAASAPPSPAPCAPDLLLDGLIVYFEHGCSCAQNALREALTRFEDVSSMRENLRWFWLASVGAALRIWSYQRWDTLSVIHVSAAREIGALSELPLALTSRACALLFAGELASAASLVDEIETITAEIGGRATPYASFILAAFRGDEPTTTRLTRAAIEEATRHGEGTGVTFAHWASAVLYNSVGRYDMAFSAAQQACRTAGEQIETIWAFSEMAEAASRLGDRSSVMWCYQRLAELTGDEDWGAGILARVHALLSAGDEAASSYEKSTALLGRTHVHVETARAHLLYGEWLRREGRKSEAKERLREAYSLFNEMGLIGFATRARGELKAAGAKVNSRPKMAPHEPLTAQEARIARLARDGLTNPEIGMRLFLSTHTVQYHLRKVFAKLGVTSRSQLDRVLPGSPLLPRVSPPNDGAPTMN